MIGFDLDGTLTQHRTPLGEEPKALLAALSEKYKVIMIGADNAPRIYRQMAASPLTSSPTTACRRAAGVS